MCYFVKSGSSATKDVYINGREPPKLGTAMARPLEVRAWLTPRNASFCHVFNPSECGRSRSNGTRSYGLSYSDQTRCGEGVFVGVRHVPHPKESGPASPKFLGPLPTPKQFDVERQNLV